MKRIISIILVITVFTMFFAGCTKKEELKTFNYEATTVDVSVIAENKSIFESRIPSTDEQNRFKNDVLKLIKVIEKDEINDFTISFSKEKFESWEECNNYAENVDPGVSRLGSYQHYLLWLAQRIINNESQWDEICDSEEKLVTIAFVEKNAWVGSCSETSCFPDWKKDLGLMHVFKNSFHAYNGHKVWQAFVVTSVE